MASVVQEFHCHGCDHYLMVRLRVNFNQRVMMVCPVCGRKHQRVVEDGVIRDLGKRCTEGHLEEILIPKSAASPTARSHKQEQEANRKAKYSLDKWHRVRDGVIIESPRSLIDESWFERYGDRV